MEIKNKFKCQHREKWSGWCRLLKKPCKIYGLVEGARVLVCEVEKTNQPEQKRLW